MGTSVGLAAVRLRTYLLVPLVAATANCEQQPPDPPDPTLVIHVSYVEDVCKVNIAGRLYTSFEKESRLMILLRREAKTHERARVVGRLDAPYHCIGGTIFTAQQAGIAHVTFVPEPLPGTAPTEDLNLMPQSVNG